MTNRRRPNNCGSRERGDVQQRGSATEEGRGRGELPRRRKAAGSAHRRHASAALEVKRTLRADLLYRLEVSQRKAEVEEETAERKERRMEDAVQMEESGGEMKMWKNNIYVG